MLMKRIHGQVVVDLGTILIDQARHIIMNTEHLKSCFSYYYTYKIGGQLMYQSEECVVNRYLISQLIMRELIAILDDS